MKFVGGTYGHKVAVNYAHRMKVLQSFRCFRELTGYFNIRLRKTEISRTRRRRLTSGCFDTKSMMFPSIIHSETMHNGNNFGETPSTGRTLGCERRLQITISWNKRFRGSSEAHVECQILLPTCLMFARFSGVYARNAFIHTGLCGDPSRHPRTHRRRTRCPPSSRCCLR